MHVAVDCKDLIGRYLKQMTSGSRDWSQESVQLVGVGAAAEELPTYLPCPALQTTNPLTVSQGCS